VRSEQVELRRRSPGYSENRGDTGRSRGRSRFEMPARAPFAGEVVGLAPRNAADMLDCDLLGVSPSHELVKERIDNDPHRTARLRWEPRTGMAVREWSWVFLTLAFSLTCRCPSPLMPYNWNFAARRAMYRQQEACN